MQGISVRFVLAFLLLGVILLPAGCSNQPEPTAEVEMDEPAPPPPPKPEPKPEPTVDPNAWKTGVKDVYFDYDRYELRGDARALLQENARILKENTGATVVMEGHCDERGTEEYNLALGQRRADAVRTYLTDLGVSASRLQTISYGEEKPFAAGQDESAWSQNRRVHFKIQ